MRVLAATMILAFLAGPALAQEKRVPKYGEEDKAKTSEEKQAERDAEKAYRRSLGNIPEQKPVDPWGTPYIYRCPGQHNVDTYDLVSPGPDLQEGTADDINNWSQK